MAEIAFCRIYPGIGIARVGNSPTEFFVGPEAPGRDDPPPENSYRDKSGRIKRQAARFRIYGYDGEGKVVQELTDKEANITWTVHLANTKPAYFEWRSRFVELKEAEKERPLRNPATTDRDQLKIDPGPRSIGGVNAASGPFGGVFRPVRSTGDVVEVKVTLGELHTDDAGRLIVLGGFGNTGCTLETPNITNYSNNDCWHDDVSDGPVSVKVEMKGDGRPIPCKSYSWVIVAPPKFAPGIVPIVTLYEVMTDVAISQGKLPKPDRVSFTNHIYPILQRLVNYRWVNATSLRGHGPGTGGDFLDSRTLDVLRSRTKKGTALRRQLIERVRNPHIPYLDPKAAKKELVPDPAAVKEANDRFMPPFAGDNGDPIDGDPTTWQRLLKSQYDKLKNWAEGDFDDDWPGKLPIPPLFDEVPIHMQPDALDRAALEPCIGGPWYPGIEITYIAEFDIQGGPPNIYDADPEAPPFRVKPTLAPGEITCHMALPWQADFNECADHWWPAQRPDDVVTSEEFDKILSEIAGAREHDKNDPTLGESLEAALPSILASRSKWARGLRKNPSDPSEDRDYDPSYSDPRTVPRQLGDLDMVRQWSDLGFVVRRNLENVSVFIETERDPYAGLSEREYFYLMMNVERHRDFLPRARSLAQWFLDQAWKLRFNVDADRGELIDFRYSKEAFDARLRLIYNHLVHDAATYNPALDPVYRTRDQVIERIRQLAPFNQLDGAWLRNIVAGAGPIDEIRSALFSVWSDETGNGNIAHSHSNVYSNLLQDVGIYLPAIDSLAYAKNPEMLDSAFTVPLFELVISQFTEEFFPEILGMTLMLEWEVVSLKPGIQRLRYFGINSLFYEMHVGIDNAANGHGAMARKAVETYLDKIAASEGEEAMQETWKRIWMGYVAFRKTGDLASDLVASVQQQTDKLTRPVSIDEQMRELIMRKKPVAELNHGTKMLGPNLINDWFDDPDGLLRQLQDSGLIIAGDADNSPFFRLLSFEGPMYQVFSPAELDLWRKWTLSLARASIDSITPTFGTIDGGTSVTIEGKGFVPGSVVKFGDSAAEIVELHENLINAKTPKATQPCYAIVRIDSSGEGVSANDIWFRYLDPKQSNNGSGDNTYALPVWVPHEFALTPFELMRKTIKYMKSLQSGTLGHTVVLSGPDPADFARTVRKPISWWFEQPPSAFMGALCHPDNGWIVPGDSARSALVLAQLTGNSEMAKALSNIVPGTEHFTYRDVLETLGAETSVIRQQPLVMPRNQGLTFREAIAVWIESGCPIPEITATTKEKIQIVEEMRVTVPRGRALLPRRERVLKGMGPVH